MLQCVLFAAGVYGDIVGHSVPLIELHPPGRGRSKLHIAMTVVFAQVQKLVDVVKDLDGIMKVGCVIFVVIIEILRSLLCER